MIADYFELRKCSLDVEALYRREGAYSYSSGVNWRAVASLAAGVLVALVGLAVPSLRWLYDYAWFVGFLVAGFVYLSLMKPLMKRTGRGVSSERWEASAPRSVVRDK